jgi:hypothetical protein
MTEQQIKCWEWLNDRKNFAGVSVKFNRDFTYKEHYVTWHVEKFGWVSATGQSFEEAVTSAINTRLNYETQEYFPG